MIGGKRIGDKGDFQVVIRESGARGVTDPGKRVLEIIRLSTGPLVVRGTTNGIKGRGNIGKKKKKKGFLDSCYREYGQKKRIMCVEATEIPIQ